MDLERSRQPEGGSDSRPDFAQLRLTNTENTPTPQPDPAKKRKFTLPSPGRDIKKWAIIAAVATIVIVVALIFVFARRSDAAMWTDVTASYKKADYAKAAELLGDTGMPSNQEHLSIYADTMLATRKLDKALPAYEALYKENQSDDVKIRIGNIYNEQKQYAKAAEVYQAVIEKNPSYVQAYVNLATVKLLQSDRKGATEVAKQGVEANATNVTLNELLVSMLLENKNSADYKSAVASLKKLNPDSPLLTAIEQ